MFWDTIDTNRRSILNRLINSDLIEDCYLAGGTALAFQLGHRVSIDFDWFSPVQFSPETLQHTSLQRFHD